jgi:hypothetical protein
MGTKEKLIKRFKELPKDFTFEELCRLLLGFGFEISNKGKTSGSRVRFVYERNQSVINIHKPHPSNIMDSGALKDVYNRLILFGFIN